MSIHNFLKRLEDKGLLSEGFESGVIPPHFKTHFEISKDYNRIKRQNPSMKQKEIIHELTVLYRFSYNWIYRVIKTLE